MIAAHPETRRGCWRHRRNLVLFPFALLCTVGSHARRWACDDTPRRLLRRTARACGRNPMHHRGQVRLAAAGEGQGDAGAARLHRCRYPESERRQLLRRAGDRQHRRQEDALSRPHRRRADGDGVAGPDFQIAEIDAETMLHKAGDRIERLIGRDKVLVLLGGDDTIPYVGVRSVARQRKQRIAVLKFDSHYDLAWEPRYWAGSQWARCFEGGYLDPANFAEIGIRGTRNSLAWHEAARELNIGIWTLQDVEEKGIRQCVHEAIARICRDVDALYLSLDLDVIDPAFLPAQKYPDPAGLTAREILQALRLAIEEGPPVVGFDMACLGPDFDVNGLGAQLAARCAVEVIGGLGWKRAKAARIRRR